MVNNDGDDEQTTTSVVRMASTGLLTTSTDPSSSSLAPTPLILGIEDDAGADLEAAPAAPPNVTDLFYQSDYRVEHIGKHVKSSKRRVTWTFYRRAAAAAASAAKEEEEGEEDKKANNNDDIPIEVCLEWSLRSGKQRISVNGTVEYFTQRKNASLVEHQWELLPITPPPHSSYSCCSLQNTTTTTPPNTVVSDTATSSTTTNSCTINNSTTIMSQASSDHAAGSTTPSSPGNNNKNMNHHAAHKEAEKTPAPAPAEAWLILHLVAARVKPNGADVYSSFVLEELLLDNVRFCQLPNRDGQVVSTAPPAKLYELSTAGTNRPTSILDILYPAGVTGPAVFGCASPTVATAAAATTTAAAAPRLQNTSFQQQQQANNIITDDKRSNFRLF